jgi:uncharacterized membrane protein YkvA (DUF1232 family)
MNTLFAFFLALKDRRTPWYVKAILAGLVIYGVSPIDGITDFFPFLGYVDDVTVVSAGLYLISKLIPRQVMEDSRARIKQKQLEKNAG